MHHPTHNVLAERSQHSTPTTYPKNPYICLNKNQKMDSKSEINALIAQMPEAILPELCDYLQKLVSATVEDTQMVMRLRQILTEDKNLLLRLAQ